MSTTVEGIGYIDGRYCPRGELALPVTDLGFALGDMAYDALHVWKGAFFRLEDHLERFERSLAARRYQGFPAERETLRRVLAECVQRSGLDDAMVTMVATRGEPVGPTKDLRTCVSRLLAWAAPYYAIASPEQMTDGMAVVVSDVRRTPPESVDPTVKNFNRLDFCAALLEAYDRGCDHAILLDAEGNVTEGRGWNLFALYGGRLVTPQSGVLEGITRRTVIELCAETNLTVEAARLPGAELEGADEVFITSSAGGIMPVTRIDDRPVGRGRPGPVTHRLTGLYWGLHEDPRYTTPVAEALDGRGRV